MTEAAYTTAARTVGWLMREIESAMERFSPNASVDSAVLRSICSARVPTHDEIAVATNALLDLGILRPAGRTYSFDAQAFIATRDYRRGFQDGLAAAVRRTQPGDVSLCIAVPPGLPPRFREGIADAATDLRAGIVNVVAAASYRLVLASPFWDVSTAADIGGLARRRVDAGVRLDILGRFDAQDEAKLHLERLFSGCKCVRLFRWYEPTPHLAAVTTFHFKAVVADEGARAYVGTANLTRSSLRSTMELGFIVGGAQGRAVARIVDAVINISEEAQR
jgi:hypothetical protein